MRKGNEIHPMNGPVASREISWKVQCPRRSLDLQIVFDPHGMPVVSPVHEFRWITGPVDQIVIKRSERYIMLTLVEGVHQGAIVFEVVGGAEVIEYHTTRGSDAEHQEHEKFGHFEILFNSFLRFQATKTVQFTDRKVVPMGSNRFRSIRSSKCRIKFSSGFLCTGG